MHGYCALPSRSPSSLRTEVLNLPAAKGASTWHFSRHMPPVDGVHQSRASQSKVCNLQPMSGWWRFSFSSYLNLGQPVRALPTPQLSRKLAQAFFVTVVQSLPLSFTTPPTKILILTAFLINFMHKNSAWRLQSEKCHFSALLMSTKAIAI